MLALVKDKIKGLFKGGFFHIFGANTINKIIAFCSSFILVRILSKSMYGTFAYANNIFSIIMLFSGLGAASAMFQLACEKFDDQKSTSIIFNYGFKYGISFNIFLTLLILFCSIFIPFQMENANYLLRAMMFMPIFVLIYEFIQLRYRYQRKNQIFSYLSVANSVLVLGFSISGALLWDAVGFILLRYLAYISIILVVIIKFKFPLGELKQRDKLSKPDRKVFIKLATISLLTHASVRMLLLLDVFFIGLFIHNSEIIAGYKVATLIPTALLFIPGALMMYVYPYFVANKDHIDWVKKNYIKITKYFALFNFIVTLILFIFSPFIVTVVFGETYLDSVLPFRLLIISYFFNASFRKVVVNLLVSQRKLKVTLYIGIGEGILNIIGNIILIQRLGSTGAAISTLGVSLISSAFCLIYFLNYLKFRRKELAPV